MRPSRAAELFVFYSVFPSACRHGNCISTTDFKKDREREKEEGVGGKTLKRRRQEEEEAGGGRMEEEEAVAPGWRDETEQ